jgi:HAT1-interacting factor 1
MASSSENTGAPTEEPQAPQPPASNPSEEAEGPQTLDRAQELFDQGSKAIEDGDFVEAVDCLSRALEIRSDSELPPFSRVRV